MPVSEDEFERPIQVATSQTTMSKAEQRKSKKPIMEKRRRARINHCLNELKTLILDAMKKDPARHSKLEKADILEMTVKHLQQIQRQQLATAVATDPGVIMRFKSGFDECAAEVSRYIGRLEGVDNGVKQRLTAHLHRCVTSLQQIPTFPHQNMFSTLNQNCDKTTIMLPNIPPIPEDVNNNSNQNTERIQIPGGLHLIPSRLPTGELALLVPNSNQVSAFLNTPAGATFQFPTSSVLGPNAGGTFNTSTNHTSAFTAVNKNQEYPSPTSTADIIKKEPTLSEKDNFKSSSYLNRLTGPLFNQNYDSKVTENNEGESLTEYQGYKNTKLLSVSHDTNEAIQNYGKLNTFMHTSLEESEYNQKITQKASSSSFQKNAADSTTSFTHIKEEETNESGFKPFQVEIPNSHLKAHISISKTFDEIISPVQIHHKPNPNFTINPNKLHQKSPPKYYRNYINSENSFSSTKKNENNFEKSTKVQPISKRGEEINDLDPCLGTDCSTSLVKPSSSQNNEYTESKLTENLYSKSMKRPFSNEFPEIHSPTSCSPLNKTPRISLNVTLTESQAKNEQIINNNCKRISVIVEDSSKNNVRENNKEVVMNVSSNKDMWRPW